MKKWVIQEPNGTYLTVKGGVCLFHSKRQAQLIIDSLIDSKGCVPIKIKEDL